MEWIDETEKEIDKLKENKYGISVKKEIIRGGVCAEILIPQGILPKEITEEEIEFRLFIDTFSLKLYPKLYCLTPYMSPNLADGRDLYKELKSTKKKDRFISFDNLLDDILDFIKINHERGGLIFCGNYYLGGKYDLRMLQKGSNNITNVKENILINGKNIKFNRVLVVSEVNFLLFQPEKWYKNNLTLMFWSSINNIEKIQKLKDNKSIILHWNSKDKENPYLMKLTFANREPFVQDLLEKMKNFGMNYEVMKANKNNEIDSNSFASSMNLQHKNSDDKTININKINNLISFEEKKRDEKEKEEEKKNEKKEEKINENDNKNKKGLIKNENELDDDEINIDIDIGKNDKK